MNRVRYLFILAAIASVSLGDFCKAEEAEKKAGRLNSAKETQEHFSKSASHFLYKRFETSAAELRKAILLIEVQHERGSGETKVGISKSLGELRNLARRLDKKSVPWIRDIEPVFLRASLALTSHHLERAQTLWPQGEERTAASDLEAAVLHLEEAFVWTHRDIDAKSGEALKRAHELAQNVTGGKAYDAQAFEAALGPMNSVVKRLMH